MPTSWRLTLLAIGICLGGALSMMLRPWLDLELEFGLAWLYGARGVKTVPREVVIVAIDEATPGALGLPELPRDWPRALHADLVRFLSSAGAGVIALDATFDTPSPAPDQDQLLAQAFARAGNVLASETLRRREYPLNDRSGRPLAQLVIEQSVTPVGPIADSLRGHAPFLLPKTARVDAWWPYPGGQAEHPSLPLLALQTWLHDAARADRAFAPRGRLDRAAAAVARLEPTADALPLNHYGPARTVPTLSYAELIEVARSSPDDKGIPPGLLAAVAGKAVFVGFSARTPTGQDRLRDDYRTVFSRDDGMNLSGVEIAATAFANLLEDSALRPLPIASQWGVLGACAVVLALLCGLLRPAAALLAVAALMAAYIGWALARFDAAASWWPIVVPVAVQAPLALLIGLGLHYARTQRERSDIAKAFGYYVPKSKIDELLQGRGSMTQGNQVVYGSCLSTDVSRYTSLAETMAPERLGHLLNAYFAELFVPVERSGGHVMDVVGDAMVAFWTAAASRAETRRRACEAALDIVAAVNRFNQADPERPALETRFGLHAGEVLIGNVGASNHYEYRAVGDIVNTATRLEALNKTLSTRLLASEEAIADVPGLLTRPLGRFRLAGKAQVLHVVEIRCRMSGAEAREPVLCERFAAALESHDAQRWPDAIRAFEALLADNPQDGPVRFYLARCIALATHLPHSPWDPTVVIDTK